MLYKLKIYFVAVCMLSFCGFTMAGSSGDQVLFEQAKLIPKESSGNGGAGTFFGYDISVSGNTMLVGATRMLGHGVVYFYELVTGEWELQSTLIPDDAYANDQIGYSVSLDGTRAIISAVDHLVNGNQTGAVYVFDYINQSWQQTAQLVPSDGGQYDKFGYQVSLLGNNIAVGSPFHDSEGSNAGAVYIYSYDGSNWIESAKLQPLDLNDDSQFGHSLVMTQDKIAIGAIGDNQIADNSGAVYSYELDNGQWVQMQKLVASDAHQDGFFGHQLSLDNNTLLVGAYGFVLSNNFVGSAYVFDYDSGNWSESTKLIASENIEGQEYGFEVYLENDLALVTALQSESFGNSGKVFIFSRDQNIWTEQTILNTNDNFPQQFFGHSIHLDSNGLNVSAPGDDDSGRFSGSVFRFEYDGTDWNEAEKISAEIGDGLNNFGRSVSLGQEYALVGAEGTDDVSKGAAYVYKKENNLWIEQQKLLPSDIDDGFSKRFGHAVSLHGTTAAISADLNSSVYIFKLIGNSWVEQQKIQNNSSFSNFGFSVELEGDRLVIGDIGEDENGSQSGAVYIYDLINDDWVESVKLIASDGSHFDYFGQSISHDSNRIAVGAYFYNNNGQSDRTGAVYIFEHNGVSWVEKQKLLASDGEDLDRFGYSVSLSGDRVVVGADYDDDMGISSGSVYVFDYDGINWVQTIKLNDQNGTMYGHFGRSVDIEDESMVVGADSPSDSGEAIVFHFDGVEWVQSYRLNAKNGARGDYFGYSVSIKNNLALIGGYGADELAYNSGVAYVHHVFDVIFRNGFEAEN